MAWKPTHRFIGYPIEGAAAAWQASLMKALSARFGAPRLHERIPPHLTICRPFEVEDPLSLESVVQAWSARTPALGTFSLAGFGSFGEAVIFANAEADQPAWEAAAALQEVIKAFSVVSEEAFPVWHPHATLIKPSSSQQAQEIREYLEGVEKPAFALPFDRVAVFRFAGEGVWTVAAVFKLGVAG